MYMKGMYHINKLTPDGIEKGLTYLQQSIENNPDEPLAHAGIAIAYLAIAHGAVIHSKRIIQSKNCNIECAGIRFNIG